MCVFALKGASGAENFLGVQREPPLVGCHVLGCCSIGENRKKSSKNWEKWEIFALVILKLRTIENKT